MTPGEYPYPPDEFDSAAAHPGPQGVHRQPRSRRARFGPFVLVLILFPLLAYGVVTWLSDRDAPGDGGVIAEETPGEETGETPTETAEAPEAEETPDAGEPEPTEEPTTPPPPAPEPDLTRAVEVFNSTNRAGLAASAAEVVQSAGFTSVTPGNWGGTDPDASVVYYPSAADVATAQAVADALGIAQVQESAEDAGEQIVVVLAADYDA